MILSLILVSLAGALIMDVALELWRTYEGVERRRQAERDRIAMRRTIERTGGPRP